MGNTPVVGSDQQLEAEQRLVISREHSLWLSGAYQAFEQRAAAVGIGRIPQGCPIDQLKGTFAEVEQREALGAEPLRLTVQFKASASKVL